MICRSYQDQASYLTSDARFTSVSKERSDRLGVRMAEVLVALRLRGARGLTSALDEPRTPRSVTQTRVPMTTATQHFHINQGVAFV